MKHSLKLFFAPTLTIFSLAVISATNAATITVNPIADAFVTTGSASNPGGFLNADNFGGGGALVLAAPGLPNGEFQTVLKFDLASTLASLNSQFGVGQWTVQSVALQLTASPHANIIYNPVAKGSFGVSLMQNNSWVEGTGNAGAPSQDGISYDSLVNTYENSAVDEALGVFDFVGGSTGTADYGLNISGGVESDLMNGGDLSLRLFANDSNVSYLFSSIGDGTPVNRPELIITVVPEPGTLGLCTMGLVSISLWRRARRS